jgi:hypothetical protein
MVLDPRGFAILEINSAELERLREQMLRPAPERIRTFDFTRGGLRVRRSENSTIEVRPEDWPRIRLDLESILSPRDALQQMREQITPFIEKTLRGQDIELRYIYEF